MKTYEFGDWDYSKNNNSKFVDLEDKLITGIVIGASSNKYYIKEGIFHRLDGPAFEDKIWFYEGKKIDCDTQEEFERLLALKAFW